MEIKSQRSKKTEDSTFFNEYADIMLERIQTMISENNNKNIKIDSGIVESVNSDGTVNVYFPPDDTKVFTNISNLTHFQLVKGDNVEILIKNGNYSNCWVIAKHGNTELISLNANNPNEELIEMVANLQQQILELLQSYTTLSNRVNQKAPLSSPTFTGTVRAPTVEDASDSSTKVATTEFVQAAISAHS